VVIHVQVQTKGDQANFKQGNGDYGYRDDGADITNEVKNTLQMILIV
jgi:hypothetical protein